MAQSRNLSFSLSSTRRLLRNNGKDSFCNFSQMLTTRLCFIDTAAANITHRW